MSKIKQNLTGTKEMFKELKQAGFSVGGLVPAGTKAVKRPEGEKEVEVFTAEVSREVETRGYRQVSQTRPAEQVNFEGNETMLRSYLMRGYRILYQERSSQGVKAILRREGGNATRSWEL